MTDKQGAIELLRKEIDRLEDEIEQRREQIAGLRIALSFVEEEGEAYKGGD